jgi:hypothetical protein
MRVIQHLQQHFVYLQQQQPEVAKQLKQKIAQMEAGGQQPARPPSGQPMPTGTRTLHESFNFFQNPPPGYLKPTPEIKIFSPVDDPNV